MGLALGDWIEFAREFASTYATWFADTLTHASRSPIEFSRSARSKRNLPVVLGISIFIGITLGSVIPGRPPMMERATVFVIILVLWVFYGIILHGLCLVMRGKATIGTTIVVMLQLLAIAYVISNFFTLLLSFAGKTFPIVHEFIEGRAGGPGTIILVIQLILLCTYIPISLGGANHFNLVKRIVIAIVAPSCMYLLSFITFGQGGC